MPKRRSTPARRKPPKKRPIIKPRVGTKRAQPGSEVTAALPATASARERENTKLHRVQRELDAARARYDELYEASPVGLLTLDASGTIVEANLRACTLLGVVWKDVIHQPLKRFIVPEDAEALDRHRQDVLRRGTRQHCQLRVRDRTGAVRWIRLKSLAALTEQGSAISWRTAVLDITDQERAQRALKVQRAQLDGVIGSAMDAIITVDEHQRIVIFNSAAESMFLCPAAEAIGQSVIRFVPERFRESHRNHFQAFARSRETMRRPGQLSQLVGLRANGEEFPFEGSISQVTVGEIKLFTIILRDITDRKRAEERLAQHESRFRSTLDNLLEGCQIIGFDWRYSYVNAAAGRHGRRGVDDLLGRTMMEVYPGIEHTALFSTLRRCMEDHVSSAMENEFTFPDGSTGKFQLNIQPVPEGLFILSHDITHRKQAEEELQRNEEELQLKRRQLETLTAKLLTTQERERLRIARELHDDFSQRLAALVIDLSALEQQPPVLPELIPTSLEPVRVELEQLADDVHNLAYTLHPSLLVHAGLQPALEDHIQQVTKRTGLPILFKARDVPSSLSLEHATCLFRVLQESLRNIVKHAHATEVTVRLSGSSKGVGISVMDNGQGFNSEGWSNRQEGLGLTSMQERMRLVNGFFRIHSRPTTGTKVCAWIPFREGKA